jgi:hypothetical protein
MMFGCALLINETAESYIWLLKTWLEAMLGCAPSTIITDNDKAIGEAILQRYCQIPLIDCVCGIFYRKFLNI